MTELSRDFNQLDTALRIALAESERQQWKAQAIFSWIKMNELWKDARLLYDSVTGELFESRDDAPDDADIEVSDKERFTSQEDWIRSLEGMPGFARSTCLRRHSAIKWQMEELGRPFESAVRTVMLSVSAAETIRDAMEEESCERLVKALPALQSIPEDQIDDDMLRHAAVGALEEADASLEEGARPQHVVDDMKKRIWGEPKVSIFRPNEMAPYGAMYGVYYEENVESPQRFFLVPVDESGEPCELPAPVRNEMNKRMRVQGRKLTDE